MAQRLPSRSSGGERSERASADRSKRLTREQTTSSGYLTAAAATSRSTISQFSPKLPPAAAPRRHSLALPIDNLAPPPAIAGRKGRPSGLAALVDSEVASRDPSWCPTTEEPPSPTSPRSPGVYGPGTRRNEYFKDSRVHALIRLETLSRVQSKTLFTIVYVMVAGCLGISTVSYWFQYACSNVCADEYGEPLGCGDSRRSSSCMTVHPPGSANGTTWVNWTGKADGLSFFNRFVHFMWTIDNPFHNVSNSSYIESLSLDFDIVVAAEDGTRLATKSLSIEEICTRAFKLCDALQLPLEGIPLQRGYNVNISLDASSDVLRAAVHTALLSFEYQRKQYTVSELVGRYLMIVITLYVAVAYVLSLRSNAAVWMTEQQYILAMLFFLMVYLDPLYALATYMQSDWGDARAWPVIQYVEYHNTVYFLAAIQVMLAVLMTSVRRQEGWVDTATHIGWLIWFVTVVAVDTAVGLMVGAESAYTWTVYNFFLYKAPNSLSTAEIVAVGFLVVAELSWALWTVRATVRSRNKLATQGYFESRHRQLSFRYMAFLVWGFLFYWCTSFVVEFTANHEYGRSAYRTNQEIGAVIMSFCTVMVLVFIYSPAPPSRDAPPAPYDPTWSNPRWKREKWRPEWFEWLGKHGGSLYFFNSYREVVRWLMIQSQDETSGAGGELRFFFCLETSIDLLNLSYRVYFPPSAAESPAVFRCYPTGTHCRCVVIALALASAAAAEAAAEAARLAPPESPSGAAPAEGPPAASEADPVAVSSPTARLDSPLVAAEGVPPEWDATPPAQDQAEETGTADVGCYGWVMYDHIEQEGMQVFVCADASSPRVAVVFRGTDNRSNVEVDAAFWRQPWQLMCDGESEPGGWACGCCRSSPLIHGGFLRLWQSLEEAVLHSLGTAVEQLSPATVYVTGHSLGGAVAAVCAYAARRRLRKHIPIVVYTFGSPKLGNATFQQCYNLAVPNTFRVVNELDIVTRLWCPCCSNLHVGREVAINRNGDIVVEPTWIERFFNRAKRGASLHAHGLSRYADALDAVADKYRLRAADGTRKRAGVRKDFDEAKFARRWAVVGPEDDVGTPTHRRRFRLPDMLLSPLRRGMQAGASAAAAAAAAVTGYHQPQEAEGRVSGAQSFHTAVE
eukprot:TRINITY_DN36333_c0_g1_i3.p1 TRINITY_DN36333_c0_g1~~TRINITY_DN36333_c0_g1_i3.p1  ORF type:complete len:1159 (+),score=327.99 TRINITY_DN36333_c0_g1_i3:82-3477(+)